jgi:hypothetical protein
MLDKKKGLWRIKTETLMVVMVLFAATSLSAMTIETETERDTIYNRPKSVQGLFGKLPSSEEYGIFLNIQCRVEDGENDKEALFFRLKSEVVLEDDTLYAMIDGKKILLAKKKWIGWGTADGVEIQHSMDRSTNYTFKVWVEVE